MERSILCGAFEMEILGRVGFEADLCWETVHQLTAPPAVEQSVCSTKWYNLRSVDWHLV